MQHPYERWFGLRDKIAQVDPVFEEALRAADGRSLIPGNKLENLFLIVRDQLSRLASQNIVEFGAYRGGSALFMAQLLRKFSPSAKVYALDTFVGMPAGSAQPIDRHKDGQFADCDLDGLMARKAALGLDNLEIVKGRIEDTFFGLPERSFGLAHIDVDLFSAVTFAQNASWEHLVPGGYMVYDDADAPTTLGATHAALDFVLQHHVKPEQVWPHWVFRKP
ncbi:MAG: class I SAM-dependent methyltransferase [Phycisphaerales bacterium]|nr:class I SAM-dependent methyltransferase [Hyphomonadaceae bacterium]